LYVTTIIDVVIRDVVIESSLVGVVMVVWVMVTRELVADFMVGRGGAIPVNNFSIFTTYLFLSL
jgi:hypothetical protein